MRTRKEGKRQQTVCAPARRSQTLKNQQLARQRDIIRGKTQFEPGAKRVGGSVDGGGSDWLGFVCALSKVYLAHVVGAIEVDADCAPWCAVKRTLKAADLWESLSEPTPGADTNASDGTHLYFLRQRVVSNFRAWRVSVFD